ncbi:hypothetical protein KI809_19580 [Geobacter pelophilus]|uniref:Uncharacterized protein n=1 Tax=Geoanaerobacter pelophilus TaxID=60036 RepID=A0AAW4LDK4_9BACT|nr:hypothetical protein [Geoanaerobacter pelophilus]MBT0666516.1 hypothetical protein [Geoanaerobacter pelophilus]
MIFSKFNMRSTLILVAVLLFLVGGISALAIDFDLEGDFEGIYVLEGKSGKFLEIKDDVLLGEYDRVLFKKDLPWLHALIEREPAHSKNEPHLKLSWNRKAGHGFIYNNSPDGTKFVICLSRFQDSNGKAPRGIFIGGGLPYSRYEASTVQLNETGVAFYNGERWFHIWCNANEAVAGGRTPEKMIFPSSWEFLGSKVHYDTSKKAMLQSSHRVTLDGVPFQIDRFIIYRAGDRYFLLANRFKNLGTTPSAYYFVYGDEPWVGNYGSSGGNVGWTQNRLYFYEALIDTKKYTFAGMFDKGNPLILGEKGPYSGMANFIEWFGDIRPDLAYFSNKEGKVNDESARIPLSSRDNRVMFLQWGPRVLAPQQSETSVIAIGMADKAAEGMLPVKPDVRIDWSDIHYIMTNQ